MQGQHIFLVSKIIVLSFIFCTPKSFSQTPGEWTWMHGDNTPNSPGVFGTQGITSPSNRPPALYEPCEWKDNNGDFWLFGGLTMVVGIDTYAALWKYSVATNQWTWMKGPSTVNQAAVYGTQGVPAATNHPGSRGFGAATWTDGSGNLWLFGGVGDDVNGISGPMNDLWKYNISTNEWTWMKGPNVSNNPGIYGAQGVASTANVPPSRCETSCTWIDNTGNLWLYGGSIFGGSFGDLWKYTISTNEWTWMHGANTLGPAPIHGTQGVAVPANTPGGRIVYASWTDLSGNYLWLFAGAEPSGFLPYNDLWRYDIAANQWTWVKGSNTTNNTGSYGTKCIPTASNVPPARVENRARVRDACGNFWNFGGLYSGGSLNDLWHYNLSTNDWTWVSGENTVNQTAVYGVQGISAPTSKPGAKSGSVGWIDNSGYIWIFGGYNLTGDVCNDLFRFVPDPSCTPMFAVVTASGNATICTGQSVTLSATGTTSYSWSTGETTSNIAVTPTISTTYTVIGSRTCGFNTSSVTVTVIPNITAAVGPNTTICSGQSTILTATGGGNYLWNTAETTSSITVFPTASSTYSVIISMGSCSVTVNTTVAVNPGLTATVGNNIAITSGDSTVLSATGGGTYYWSPSTGLNCTTCATPIAKPSQTTSYCVLVTDTNGCTDNACITIEILCEPLYIPNAFSPNNDQENDLECVYGDCVEKFHLTIYNRWGEKVFESTDQNYCWDGTHGGQPLNTAVFSYYLQATLNTGEQRYKAGNISLIR